jgi:hypothetical protein
MCRWSDNVHRHQDVYYGSRGLVEWITLYSVGKELIDPSTDNFNNAAFSFCNTDFIFEGTWDVNPRTNIICGAAFSGWNIYRTPPVTAGNGESYIVKSLSSFSSSESLPVGPISSFSSGSSSTPGNCHRLLLNLPRTHPGQHPLRSLYHPKLLPQRKKEPILGWSAWS